MNKEILRIDHLNKIVGKTQILTDITFDVKRGELFGLLGPNGSGKTTIIRSILGLVKKNSGKILINNNDLDTNFEEAIRSVGAIVENPEFYNYMSGYQNLEIFSYMYEDISAERIKEVIELVNLNDSIYGKVKTYSLGMRQRLGIAQALLHRPKLLLLDEPTNGLDPFGINELWGHLKSISKSENVAIIIATHLLKEIEDLCERVAIIQQGELVHLSHIKEEKVNDLLDVMFEVDDKAKAYEIAKTNGFLVHLDHSILKMNITKSEIPHVNSLLVHNNISVFQIQVIQKSLQESFLEITGEHV
jgi:ABC-2 type transport system ATP-binding protein